jgi:hypothetical protein
VRPSVTPTVGTANRRENKLKSPVRGRRTARCAGTLLPKTNEGRGERIARESVVGKEAIPKLETIRRAATALYLAALAADGGAGYPYSPAKTTATLAKRYGIDPRGSIVGIVAAEYYRENGLRSPLSFDRLAKDGRPTEAGIARSVRKARDARGRLARWEVLAYRLAAALGTETIPSRSAVEGYYRKGGGDVETSYTGKGTRAGATATRGDATVEVSASEPVSAEVEAAE